MKPKKSSKVCYGLIFGKRTDNMTKEDLLDQHIHLHSHEIIPGRWLRNRSKIRTKIFLRFAHGLFSYGLFLGISIIAVWLVHWWR